MKKCIICKGRGKVESNTTRELINCEFCNGTGNEKPLKEFKIKEVLKKQGEY